MQEALSEIAALAAGELGGLDQEEVNEHGLPPGFRFHPTDEELVTFYLASKVFHGSFCGVQIAEIDLNRCEPWDLPDVAKMGEREWYFFSLRDRKYPTGLRTNRATGAGYWKATGKDREVYSTGRQDTSMLLGMKKTLVFYKGRAPKGEKTKWVMHEYRLEGRFSYRHHSTSKEEWVICRIFHKTAGEKKNGVFLHGLQELAASLSSPTNYNNSNSNNPAGSLPALSEAAAAPPSSWEPQPHQPSSCCFHTSLHHFPNHPPSNFLANNDHGDLKTILTNAINVNHNNNNGFDDDGQSSTSLLKQCKTELAAAVNFNHQLWPHEDHLQLRPAAAAFLNWGGCNTNNNSMHPQNPFSCFDHHDDDSTNHIYSSSSAAASLLGFPSLAAPVPSTAFHTMMLDAAPTASRSSCLGDSWSSLMTNGHSSAWPST